MESPLKIFTEQLRTGKRQEIEHVLPSDFLDIHESDLIFQTSIAVKGEAYTADEDLILQLSAHTEVKLPCSICNEMTFVTLKTEEIYHTLPLRALKSTIFDFTDLLREEIVLLIPHFVECHQGKCPERPHVAKFIRSKTVSPQNHFPFADL